MEAKISPEDAAERERIARRMLEWYGTIGCDWLIEVVAPKLEAQGLLGADIPPEARVELVATLRESWEEFM
jgi:hypothetical protein